MPLLWHRYDGEQFNLHRLRQGQPPRLFLHQSNAGLSSLAHSDSAVRSVALGHGSAGHCGANGDRFNHNTPAPGCPYNRDPGHAVPGSTSHRAPDFPYDRDSGSAGHRVPLDGFSRQLDTGCPVSDTLGADSRPWNGSPVSGFLYDGGSALSFAHDGDPAPGFAHADGFDNTVPGFTHDNSSALGFAYDDGFDNTVPGYPGDDCPFDGFRRQFDSGYVGSDAFRADSRSWHGSAGDDGSSCRYACRD